MSLLIPALPVTWATIGIHQPLPTVQVRETGNHLRIHGGTLSAGDMQDGTHQLRVQGCEQATSLPGGHRDDLDATPLALVDDLWHHRERTIRPRADDQLGATPRDDLIESVPPWIQTLRAFGVRGTRSGA